MCFNNSVFCPYLTQIGFLCMLLIRIKISIHKKDKHLMKRAKPSSLSIDAIATAEFKKINSKQKAPWRSGNVINLKKKKPT